MSWPHWVCPAHGVCAFPVYTAQALGCSAGNCLWWALGCMHFPGLSHSGSGSQVVHKGADFVGPSFCALPRSEKLRRPGVWRAQFPPPTPAPALLLEAAAYHLPSPSRSVFWVHKSCAFLVVPCVSSGELISGCDPPSGCQPSRIPRSLVSNEACLQYGRGCLLGSRLPPSGSGCPRLLVSSVGWAGPQLASSAQSFVLERWCLRLGLFTG